MSWADEFAPKELKEVAGNPSAIDEIRKWDGKGSLLLVGPPGCGKTASALALARERNWDLLELNSSDLRSKKELERVAGLASVSTTFSGNKRMILFDEIDELFRADYGGASAVLDIIRNTKCAIVLTANDEYAKTLSSIRKECRVIKFKKVHYATIAHVLKRICNEKKIECDDSVIDEIARTNHGDLKSAINDLQAIGIGVKKISREILSVSARDREENIFNAMRDLFKTMDYNTAVNSFNSVNEDPDTFLKWVDENIPREYTDPHDIAKAFEALSRADFYNAGIYRRQQWQLAKFQIALMTAGVATAKKHTYSGFTLYQLPTFIKNLSASKSKRAAIKSAAKKIGERIHSSPHEVLSEHWYYFCLLAKHEPKAFASFGLDEKELEAMGVTPAKAKKAVAN